MKTIKIICLFALFVVALSSCGKDKEHCYDLNGVHENKAVVDHS